MVSHHESDLRSIIYILSVPQSFGDNISGDNGGFTLVFRTFPQKSRDKFSERHFKVFRGDPSARDIHSADGQRVFPFFQQCGDHPSLYDGNGASAI